MAGPASTTSSMTSTSHTLTHAPSVGFLSAFADPSKPSSAVEMLELFEAIKSGNRHNFLQPTPSIPNASLQLAKATLDAYAGQICDEQQQRLREEGKKRKRAENGLGKAEILKIRKLHIDGFESGQVWQQARRIIASTLHDSKSVLQELEDQNEVQLNGINGDAHTDAPNSDGDISEVDSADGESASEIEDSEEAEHDVNDDEDLDEEDIEDDAELSMNGAKEDIDDFDEEDDVDGEDVDEDDAEEASQELVEDPNGLNDGFFSIDDFNKQTQRFEDADARGDPDVDNASDDDELDWHTDPFAVKPPINGKGAKKPIKSTEGEMASDVEGEDEDEEGGPTFGDMDLDAPEGDSEDEGEGINNMDGGDDFNANEIYYKDFFAPPQQKGARNGKARKFKEPRPTEVNSNDVERAIADVRRDLFEDESEREDSEDALSDVSAGDPKSRKSAHERRQVKLAEEIRKLEAANVAKREWVLSGEAQAADRPMNSLLEEDLDFEHVGKPVPVITAEVSESIEDMIKRRILAQEFDEVIKRRPDATEFSSNTRRGLVDLDDSKAKQSLAEIYEEEHVKNANPDSYVSKADEKLQKEEKEIEEMWKEVSASLDALTSWHYKPKPTAPSLTVVSDVATISMEDAQPTTAQGVNGGDHTLAPQEIYKASKDTAEKGEVVAKSGLPVAKQEMSREDKIRRRRREKERLRKAGGAENKKPQSAKAQAQKQTLGDLKMGGVKVINKKGEIVDMEGNKAKATKAASSSSFKL
ncbi:Mpp10 protein [Annulohypoxylon maeteangense]|uniref:Mpp10 protein n=1 Tax=Annulohypoxylon maeteangense TaxID=1927788 RepID=UPI0020073BCB|nr:Mpp10 protein [Annulohypoxylon maeteangense]KAI0881656.1 Mpp10 protein [Annulohypoxylon maeteangense]